MFLHLYKAAELHKAVFCPVKNLNIRLYLSERLVKVTHDPRADGNCHTASISHRLGDASDWN